MLEDIENISTIFSIGALIVALATIYFPWRTRQSERYLDQAILSLERAYSVLTSNDKQVQPPSSDRLNWLTCARLILKYKKIKELINCKEHKLICDEQEEYWRHKFYLSLNATTSLVPAYYDGDVTIRKLAIEPKSAIVIHEFVKWPSNQQDVIDSLDCQNILNDPKRLQGDIGLKAYLKSIPNLNEYLCSKRS